MELPKGNTVLSKDTRAIGAVWFPMSADPTLTGWQANESVRIEAYDEMGSNAYVPWIAVFADGILRHRVPASALVISYAADATCPHGHADSDDCPECRH